MQITQNRSIVLSSGSPRRKEYLERYKLDFKIVKGDIDETRNANESPLLFSQRMAREKALEVQKSVEGDSVIIAADTIVVFNGEVLGKPDSQDHAFEMLKSLNGNLHEVITSYFVLDCQDRKQVEKSVKTSVKFKNLNNTILENYACSPEPHDKAGAYSIQGIGTILVEFIEGSYNNVVGLPVEELFQDLISLNVISLQ